MTWRYVVRRLAQATLTVFFVATLTFVAVHLAPGDPLQVLSDSPRVAARDVAQLRTQYHLDQPVLVQYGYYLKQLARGDLGFSFAQHRPVRSALADALPGTIELAIAALTMMFAIGIAIGSWQGAHFGSTADRLISTGTLAVWAVPSFWFALLLIMLFVERWHLLPASGATDIALYGSLNMAGKIGDRLRHLVLPALALGLVNVGVTTRFQRAAMHEALQQPFVRAARARGIRPGAVRLHALRNALLPMTALLGVELPNLLSGAVIIESVFGWPGMGRIAADAIFQRDYPLVTGAAILAATITVLAGLCADVLAHTVDPRLRVAA